MTERHVTRPIVGDALWRCEAVTPSHGVVTCWIVWYGLVQAR